MIANANQLVDHQLKLYDAFIDLKVIGWKSYSKALNEYTFGFYKTQLEKTDEMVDETAQRMKAVFPTLKGVCK